MPDKKTIEAAREDEREGNGEEAMGNHRERVAVFISKTCRLAAGARIAFADDIAGAGGFDIVKDRGRYIYLYIVGRQEIEAGTFPHHDLIADLVDFHILQKVLVTFDLHGGMIALRHHDLRRSADLHVLEIVDLAVFRFYVAISMDPFAEYFAAGAEEERQGKQ